jgi:hypothetical protein
MIFSEINSGISILERLKKWWHERQNPSVVTRFVRLFEGHGVHRNQIPRFIGHGLTLKDVQDDGSLLTKLDEALLDSVCNKFSVRREWLDGAEKQIYPEHDFYKHPEEFAKFLDGLIAANPEGDIQGVLITPEERTAHIDALLILQETIGSVGNKPIYRFHLSNNWSYTYWKARAYLTACIAVAWKRQVFVTGVFCSKKEIEKIASGESMLGWEGKGIWKFGQRTWYPEDMALQPDAYLNDIDPEIDSFGIISALKLWLDLDRMGLMDTEMNKNVRQLFQQELEKY